MISRMLVMLMMQRGSSWYICVPHWQAASRRAPGSACLLRPANPHNDDDGDADADADDNIEHNGDGADNIGHDALPSRCLHESCLSVICGWRIFFSSSKSLHLWIIVIVRVAEPFWLFSLSQLVVWQRKIAIHYYFEEIALNHFCTYVGFHFFI